MAFGHFSLMLDQNHAVTGKLLESSLITYSNLFELNHSNSPSAYFCVIGIPYQM